MADSRGAAAMLFGSRSTRTLDPSDSTRHTLSVVWLKPRYTQIYVTRWHLEKGRLILSRSMEHSGHLELFCKCDLWACGSMELRQEHHTNGGFLTSAQVLTDYINLHKRVGPRWIKWSCSLKFMSMLIVPFQMTHMPTVNNPFLLWCQEVNFLSY